MGDSNSKKLQDTIREVSLVRMRSNSGIDGLRIEELPAIPLVYAHWMTLIVASGQHLAFMFKCHFMHDQARFLAAKSYACQPDAITRDQAINFFCEYCNLVGGGISQLLNDCNVMVGTSLPIWSRGFDEVFSFPPKGALTDSWKLCTPRVEIFCSSQIEVFETFDFTGARFDQNADSGRVEFL